MWSRSCIRLCFFFFKHKTAYEMRISDWSSDVCSSDLPNDGNHKFAFASHWVSRLKTTQTMMLGSLVNNCSCHIEPTFHWSALSPLLAKIGRASCRERVCQYV